MRLAAHTGSYRVWVFNWRLDDMGCLTLLLLWEHGQKPLDGMDGAWALGMA